MYCRTTIRVGSRKKAVKSSRITSEKKPAVILVGHGSRQTRFSVAMEKVARGLKKDKKFLGVVCAYLEIAKPSIAEAIEVWARRGARQIRVLPYFVLSGRHVVSHIPEIIAEAKKKYRGKVKIKLCPYLGYDEALVALAKKRIGVF